MSTSISSRSASLPPTRQQLDELDALLQRMLDLPVNQVEESALDKAAEAARRKAPPATPEPAPPEVDPPAAEEEQAGPASIEVQVQAQPASFEVGLLPTNSPTEPEPTAEAAPTEEFAPPVSSISAAPVPAPDVDAGSLSAPPTAAPEGEQEEWVPLRSSWKPSAQTWPPLVEHWQQNQSTGAVAPPSEYSPALMPSSQAPLAPPPDPEPAATLPLPQTAITAVGDEAAWLSGPLPPAEPAPLSDEAVGEAPWGLLPLVWFNQGFDACVQPLGPPGRWLASGSGKTVLGLLGLLSLGAAIALAVGDRIGWTW